MPQKVEKKFQWVVSKSPSILEKKFYLKESLFERIYMKQVTRVDLIHKWIIQSGLKMSLSSSFSFCPKPTKVEKLFKKALGFSSMFIIQTNRQMFATVMKL